MEISLGALEHQYAEWQKSFLYVVDGNGWQPYAF